MVVVLGCGHVNSPLSQATVAESLPGSGTQMRMLCFVSLTNAVPGLAYPMHRELSRYHRPQQRCRAIHTNGVGNEVQ